MKHALRSFDDIPPQCVDDSSLLFSTDNFRKAQEELFPGKEDLRVSSRFIQCHGQREFLQHGLGDRIYTTSATPLVAYTVIFKVNSENIHNSLAAIDYPQ